MRQINVPPHDSLTHIDSAGNAIMVDVSDKKPTKRTATAKGRIKMRPETFLMVKEGRAKKGDVLCVAQIAGIMAAKRTFELIPLCHPLMLEKCTVDFNLLEAESAIEAACTVEVTAKTGVEMEALTGASTALLTVYDMCKAVDRGMEIEKLCLHHKSGGRSGEYSRE